MLRTATRIALSRRLASAYLVTLTAAALAPATARGDVAGPVLAPPSSAPVDPWTGSVCMLVPRRRIASSAVGAEYHARAAAIADSASSRLELGVTARIDLALELDLGDCAGGQLVTAALEATPRWDPELGRGLDVAAAVAVNPTPTYDDRANVTMLIGSWDLAVRGRLAARPGRFAAAELDRAAFHAYALDGGLRMFRVETGECARVGDGPQAPCDPDASARSSYTIDVFPIGGSVERIDQGARRLERRWDGAMLRAIMRSTRLPFEAQLDFPRVEVREVEIAGRVASVAAIWPLYVALRNPTTGTLYRVGYGNVLSTVPVEGADPEAEPPALFAIGAGYGDLTGTGAMVGLERDATFDMRLRPAIELRGTAEAWTHLGPWAITARAVIAHSAPMAIDGSLGPGTVTGGGEVAARRRWRGIDARLDLTGGRGYYAGLDGLAPRAEWSGQAGLTLTRSGRAGTTAPGMVYAR